MSKTAERHYMDGAAGDLEWCAARLRNAGESDAEVRLSLATVKARIEITDAIIDAMSIRMEAEAEEEIREDDARSRIVNALEREHQ